MYYTVVQFIVKHISLWYKYFVSSVVQYNTFLSNVLYEQCSFFTTPFFLM